MIRCWLVLLALIASPAGAELSFSIYDDLNDERLNAIQVSGDIENGDAVQLRTYLESLPEKPNTAVYLNSRGGSLYEGLAIGRLFREMQIKTLIEGRVGCSSACAIAFLGGTSPADGLPWRNMSSNSCFGLHQFRAPHRGGIYSTPEINQIVSESQFVVLELIEYFEEMDADIDILKRVLREPNDSIDCVSPEDALQLGISVWSVQLNRFFAPEDFPEPPN